MGEEFLEHLDTYFDRITTHPKHFPQKRKPYREAFIKRFPFLIIYEITRKKVIVYSVFNTWQDPEKRASGEKKCVNYYPFGLEHKGYNNTVVGAENNYKQFQGQEWTEDLGLNIHEWKYRISDPAIGRFWQVDPLAEDYVHNGVYNFSENRVIDAIELEGLEAVLVHGTWAARGDREVYSMQQADYKGGSTWERVFSQRVASSAGWNAKSTYEYTWTGNNNTDDRVTAGQNLASSLMSEDNSFRDEKHATLIGHSHGGLVNKEAKNILEENGWTVDIINIARPQRSDHQTGESENGVYINFYNNSDVVQGVGTEPKTAKSGKRKDDSAQVNQEITISNGSWFLSGGHSYHQDWKAQNQMEKTVEQEFKKTRE